MNTFIRYVLTVGVLGGAVLLMQSLDTGSMGPVQVAIVAIGSLLLNIVHVIIVKRGLDTFLDS